MMVVVTGAKCPHITTAAGRRRGSDMTQGSGEQEAAPQVRQLSAPELKAMLDRGVPLQLVDVRTEQERAVARLEGSRLLDQATHDSLLTMDRSTRLVFQCHHGIRSQAAAEYFVRQGFTEVYNLRGGIDAWSQSVDPRVPRY